MKLLFFNIITLFTQSIMAQKTDNLSSEEKTTTKFIGEYYTGRGFCQHLPNGIQKKENVTALTCTKYLL